MQEIGVIDQWLLQSVVKRLVVGVLLETRGTSRECLAESCGWSLSKAPCCVGDDSSLARRGVWLVIGGVYLGLWGLLQVWSVEETAWYCV